MLISGAAPGFGALLLSNCPNAAIVENATDNVMIYLFMIFIFLGDYSADSFGR